MKDVILPSFLLPLFSILFVIRFPFSVLFFPLPVLSSLSFSFLLHRQENVEKTLQVLEHVISYYDVARNTQTLIREGPSGRLDNYVDSLERIKAAIAYFETNCPDSVEQVWCF